MYNWIIPKLADNAPAAKEFLLHYTANLDTVAWHSRLHDLPAYARAVPQLSGWLKQDPFGSQPTDKLALLDIATDWSRNIGYPGPTNAAEGEVFAASIIPTMFGRTARGEVSPKEAIRDAEAQIRQIFDRWRAHGLMGAGGR
jgi:multiple sugar transport system substrate-binding protein